MVISNYSQAVFLVESEICSKLPTKKTEGRHRHCSDVFSLNFVHILRTSMMFPC